MKNDTKNQKKINNKNETTHQEATKRAGSLPNGGPDKSWKDFKITRNRS
ncbi:MAG: hypothetical protein NT052_02220 [Candidatus Shapirobacteria bacterium]|nr:hypothetical protein [Candidatus Shapirobacteria bacterium]